MLRRLSLSKSPITTRKSLSSDTNSGSTQSTIPSSPLSGAVSSAGTAAQRASAAAASDFNTSFAENEGDREGKDDSERVQRKTFRRWVNKYLGTRKMCVNHIINDWENGVLLTNLLEILSQSKMPKYNLNPKLKLQCLENLNSCIAFMKGPQKITLVNVGSDDIYSHNPTIVLGLIWCLILRYSVSNGKIELLIWAQKRCETKGYDLKDFSPESWKDGMAFAALVAAEMSKSPSAPDIFSGCTPDTPVQNAEKAFNAADKYLEVDKLLDPSDVIGPLDEKSIVAYVGEIYNASVKPRPPRQIPRPPPVEVTNVGMNSVEVKIPKPLQDHIISVRLDCENSVGAVVSSIEIPVEYTPPNEASGSQAAVITHIVQSLEPEKTYTLKTVVASIRASSDSSDPVTFTTPPKVVKSAKIDKIDYTTASFSWPQYGMAQSYSVQVRNASVPSKTWNEADSTRSFTTSNTSFTVDKLESDTDYEVRVNAIGCLQNPEASIPTPLVTQMEIPKQPVIANVTDSSFDLQWSEFPRVKSFRVQVRENNETWDEACEFTVNTEDVLANKASASGNGNNLPYQMTVRQLVPSFKYEARIIAITANNHVSQPSPPVTLAADKGSNRVALITGADFKSGCALVQKLLSNTSEYSFDKGFSRVVVCAQYPSNELVALSKHPKVLLLKFNPKDAASIKNAAAILGKEVNRVDTFINNASLPADCIGELFSQLKKQ